MKDIAEILLKNKCFYVEGPLEDEVAEKLCGAGIYPKSVCAAENNVFMLKKIKRGRKLLIFSQAGTEPGKGFSGDTTVIKAAGGTVSVKTCGVSHENMNRLREVFPFTKPVTLGTRTSFGMGDRLGIATPGHIRAAAGYDFFPILPQQSIREMERTGRTPDQVMDDACLAVFQEGFYVPFGADADHLKTEEHVKYTAAAGFTFYTIDPSDHLNLSADGLSEDELKNAFNALFSSDAEKKKIIERYSYKQFAMKDDDSGFRATLEYSEKDLMRVAVKYLPAVRHTVKLHGLLCELLGAGKFDFEMSVDETSSPTTPHEHLFVASELKESGITPQSLAPRYLGEFQKGIDYIGKADNLRASLKFHALIAKTYGPYKLSIHSGSDKFSIFPIFGEITGGLFHEKTAGTSYLEAVRVISRRAPALYREIHRFALSKFEKDRASYHVTTDLSKIPDPDKMGDGELPSLLEMIDSRQLIHITYGSVLTERKPDGKFLFYDRLMDVLDANEEEHYATVAGHFVKHIEALGIKKLK